MEFKLDNVLFSNEDGIEEEAYRGPAQSELYEKNVWIPFGEMIVGLMKM